RHHEAGGRLRHRRRDSHGRAARGLRYPERLQQSGRQGSCHFGGHRSPRNRRSQTRDEGL
ncbi:uncharacterized protein METZ01_LOCUS58267, partial [marine metagenome]